eukprot:TRINITY_DN8273_c0_g1_i1.p1 TRINITY_DN8273_c0_g1~~TRINITY_DN8273_c0_g1_i1.p1  ORF type:complete len:118 (+),score=67.36 TRINITY_DN8273_c0_g1_i1:15-368(+)
MSQQVDLAAEPQEIIRQLLEQNSEQASKITHLQSEVTSLKEQNENLANCLIATEKEEEMIANKLMKQMNDLKIEKEQLMIQVEQEEEFLTNSLQRKLDKVEQEKHELEEIIEKAKSE